MKPLRRIATLKSLKAGPFRRKRQTPEELLELQRLMAGTVMQPLTPAGGMRTHWRDGRSMKRVAADFIKPNDRLTSFERLEIYNRQYWYRLKDSFYEDFPGLRALLGEKRFEAMAVAYLNQFPSASFTLRNLGRRLLGFLQAHPEWTRPRERLVLDMARLEWAHIEAFDNEAKPRLQLESFAVADPASALRLKLQPYMTLLELGYELDKFLIRLKREDRLRNEASNAKQQTRTPQNRSTPRQVQPKTIYLAVHRQGDSVYYKRLQPLEFRLLSAFERGATVAEACEALVAPQARGAGAGANRAGGPTALPPIRKWFETWAGLGWFYQYS